MKTSSAATSTSWPTIPARSTASPELRKLFFELTLQCNERCFHCGSSCTAARGDELSREEWLSIIDQVKADFGTLAHPALHHRAASRCSTATSSTSWATRTRRASAGA